MAQKRGKLTAGKARERITSLSESIAAREQKLEQLKSRLERSDSPEERLVTAKKRLERRLTIEREQLEKLQRLLGSDSDDAGDTDAFVSEEIEDIHRSFEEVRENVAQMQARLESTEVPRDLSGRLNSFEERITRREEADSDLFGQVLSLQTNLDQERQTVRRLSRRIREQDHSIDALREAVEDSVVATVDLAERLEEMEENLSERLNSPPEQPQESHEPRFDLMIQTATEGLVDEVRELKASLKAALEKIETLSSSQPAGPDQSALLERLEKLESAHKELREQRSQEPRRPAASPATLIVASPSALGPKAVFRYGRLPKGPRALLVPANKP